MESEQFLRFDRGRKTETLTTRVQPELAAALDYLSRNNISTYIREVLIIHVRQQIESGQYNIK